MDKYDNNSSTTLEISASCAIGTEKVLYNELEHLQLRPFSKKPGRVNFMADDSGIANALVNSRTADRLFLVLDRFHAKDFDELYEACNLIPWEKWVDKNDKLVIEKARSFQSTLSSQRALQSISQKAAYDRLCRVYRQAVMPESGKKMSARIRIEKNLASIELDLCGEALSKRGYRKIPTEAPIKESLAAAILYLAGWRRSFALYDPFCGSGTIPIEAALMALDIAPGLNRSFLWESMPDGSKNAIAKAKEAAKSRINMERDINIRASDIEGSKLDAAVFNTRLAGLEGRIGFSRAKAEDATPFAERGFVISDPPYGKRLGSPEDAKNLYSSLANFTDRFSHWALCFIVEDQNLPEYFKKGTDRQNLSWKKAKISDGSEIRWVHRSV